MTAEADDLFREKSTAYNAIERAIFALDQTRKIFKSKTIEKIRVRLMDVLS